jgi:hypothetical protein
VEEVLATNGHRNSSLMFLISYDSRRLSNRGDNLRLFLDLGIQSAPSVDNACVGGQPSNPLFVSHHCDVNVQISRRGKYKWWEIVRMPSQQCFWQLRVTTFLLLHFSNHFASTIR